MRTRERPEVQRAKILEAAVEVFSRRGVADASVGDIASAARISRTLLYHYFPGKTEIVEALQLEAIAEVQGLVAAMRARGGTAAQQIEFLVNQYHDVLTARPVIVNLLACGPASTPETVTPKVGRQLRQLRHSLVDWIQALPEIRTDIDATHLLLVGLGALSSWFYPTPLAHAIGARPGTKGRGLEAQKAAVAAVLVCGLLSSENGTTM
jgi:AcrR family transcriptional regulator